MNIHEHQAKEMLRQHGLPVSSGVTVMQADRAEAAAARLKGPIWAVKAQIHAGGRGKGHFMEEAAGGGGGVRITRSASEAAEEARCMLGQTLVTRQTGPAGKQVNRVYIEQGVAIAREFYLALLVDRATSRIALVASTEGGTDIEEVATNSPDRILTVTIDPAIGYQSFHGRRIAFMLGLAGGQVAQCVKLLGDLYTLFVTHDMGLLEINPLVLAEDDNLVCLDAKMGFDGNALFRQPSASALRDLTEEHPMEVEASEHGLNYIALDGEIGCLVNGAGLAMATMDVIKLHGGEPANFLDVGGGASREKVTEAFKIITSDQRVKGILVNIFGGIMRCDIIAEGIVAAVREVGLAVPLVVRLEGTNVDKGQQILHDSDVAVITANDLRDGARQIVRMVQQ